MVKNGANLFYLELGFFGVCLVVFLGFFKQNEQVDAFFLCLPSAKSVSKLVTNFELN